MLNDKPQGGMLVLGDDHPDANIALNPKTLPQSAPADAPRTSTARQKRMALWMVVAFTLLASIAQIFIKMGANALNKIPAGSVANLAVGSMHFQISAVVVAAITSIPLIGGLALYGIGAVMMVLALQHGELSVLYPIISLSYVWVAILSVVIFHEHMNVFRVGGIAVIIAGVAILGRSGSQASDSGK
jgi:drug/metabolite transporter (DMT)-like permease